MFKFKKLLLIFFVASFSMITSILSVIYVYDPMMFFHEPVMRDFRVSSNMRISAPGIIRNLDHDSYILGTSMLANTSSDYASELLNANFANISMEGADFYERSYALKALLEKSTKKVIYSADAQYLDQQLGIPEFPKELLESVYSSGYKKFRYYLNVNTIFCSLAFSSSEYCIGKATNLDMPSEWYTERTQSMRFGGVENWLVANNHQVSSALSNIYQTAEEIRNGSVIASDEKSIKKNIDLAIEYVESYFISFVRLYPDTQFYLVFPPYSRVRFAEWYQHNRSFSMTHQAVLRYVVKSTKDLSNLEIYAFENEDFLDDMSLYKDPNHHSKEINDYILESIAQKRNLVNAENIESYISTATAKGQNFDYVGFASKLENMQKIPKAVYMEQLSGE